MHVAFLFVSMFGQIGLSKMMATRRGGMLD